VAHAELAVDVIEVGELESDRLGPAQATGVEQAQEGGVASAPGHRVLAMPHLLRRPGASLRCVGLDSGPCQSPACPAASGKETPVASRLSAAS
jgi:hypothetical protein